jgi:hypothetical protein
VQIKRDPRASTAAERDVHPGGWWKPSTGRFAIFFAVALSHSEALAGECTLATPECHLENGKQLLSTNPRRAAEELLASYKLDERTDTLALYATALQADGKHALALETWQRVIVFRESELDAAKEAARKAGGKKKAAARAAAERARIAMEQAGEAIIKLWPNVGRVRVRIPAGQQIAVTRDGVEVDVSKDVLVNAGKDELVFTRKGGSPQRVVIEVAAGGSKQIDAPEPAAEPVTPVKPVKPVEPVKVEQPDPVKVEQPRPLEEPAGSVSVTAAPRSRTMSRIGLGLAAGGIIAGGIAGTFGYLASSDYDDAKAAGCSDSGQCPFGPAADLAERSNDRARVAQITAIGGGALLVTGAVLWIYGRGKTRRSAPEVTLHISPSSTAVGWRF